MFIQLMVVLLGVQPQQAQLSIIMTTQQLLSLNVMKQILDIQLQQKLFKPHMVVKVSLFQIVL